MFIQVANAFYLPISERLNILSDLISDSHPMCPSQADRPVVWQAAHHQQFKIRCVFGLELNGHTPPLKGAVITSQVNGIVLWVILAMLPHGRQAFIKNLLQNGFKWVQIRSRMK